MPAVGLSKWKTALVLGLLCLTLWTQSAALAALYQHSHPADANCALCQLGVLPLVQTMVSLHVGPGRTAEWLTPPRERVVYYATLQTPSFPRAPPR
jgi:hypothetical protein